MMSRTHSHSHSQPQSQSQSQSQSTSDEAYWLPGYGLSKNIVLRQLQYFLGPSATVRPYTLEGRDGYKIVGPRLTMQQVADLKRQSKEYERQQTIRMSGRPTSTEGQSEDADINTIVVVGAVRRSPTNYSSSYRPYR